MTMGWKMPIVIKVATAIINPEKYTLIVIGFEFFFVGVLSFFVSLRTERWFMCLNFASSVCVQIVSVTV